MPIHSRYRHRHRHTAGRKPAFGEVPAVILGPGETHMARQTDEFRVLDRIPLAVKMYKALLEDCAGSDFSRANQTRLATNPADHDPKRRIQQVSKIGFENVRERHRVDASRLCVMQGGENFQRTGVRPACGRKSCGAGNRDPLPKPQQHNSGWLRNCGAIRLPKRKFIYPRTRRKSGIGYIIYTQITKRAAWIERKHIRCNWVCS
jgi:hypothetical protein